MRTKHKETDLVIMAVLEDFVQGVHLSQCLCECDAQSVWSMDHSCKN